MESVLIRGKSILDEVFCCQKLIRTPRPGNSLTSICRRAVALCDLSMLNDSGDKSIPKPPRCPNCAEPMRLVRKTLRFGGLPELFTFECSTCGMSHTDGGHHNATGDCDNA